MKRVHAGKGVWLLMRHLACEIKVWVGTAHFTPGCTLAQYETEVEQTLLGLPPRCGPAVFQYDANAPFHWGTCDGVVQAIGRDAKANELQGRLQEKGMEMTPPESHSFALLPADLGNKGDRETSLTSWHAEG